jgi:hypothetical protein
MKLEEFEVESMDIRQSKMLYKWSESTLVRAYLVLHCHSYLQI